MARFYECTKCGIPFVTDSASERVIEARGGRCRDCTKAWFAGVLGLGEDFFDRGWGR